VLFPTERNKTLMELTLAKSEPAAKMRVRRGLAALRAQLSEEDL